ncbi:hypothetical protein I7I51_02348 [Histoplasma capsulatum]|uniref:Uncharacterized protein n=1 Tax=Ajellomyces capsulatus TaxID=5037 RepID=A0A8A1M9I8_AJECA|nr:hypothetical protein I7I51_02348 [Histoplasma capsulatum]
MQYSVQITAERDSDFLGISNSEPGIQISNTNPNPKSLNLEFQLLTHLTIFNTERTRNSGKSVTRIISSAGVNSMTRTYQKSIESITNSVWRSRRGYLLARTQLHRTWISIDQFWRPTRLAFLGSISNSEAGNKIPLAQARMKNIEISGRLNGLISAGKKLPNLTAKIYNGRPQAPRP